MTDTRPRFKYVLPDGRPILVICDHGDIPDPIITYEIRPDDPLWNQAQVAFGGKPSSRRVVYATLAQGL